MARVGAIQRTFFRRSADKKRPHPTPTQRQDVRRGRPAKRGRLLSPEPKDLLAIAQALPASAWKSTTWSVTTVKTMLSRLVAKGALRYEPADGSSGV